MTESDRDEIRAIVREELEAFSGCAQFADRTALVLGVPTVPRAEQRAAAAAAARASAVQAASAVAAEVSGVLSRGGPLA